MRLFCRELADELVGREPSGLFSRRTNRKKRAQLRMNSVEITFADSLDLTIDPISWLLLSSSRMTGARGTKVRAGH
nr:Hypothetical protein SC2p2_01250 [Methylocystis sp. SC2]